MSHLFLAVLCLTLLAVMFGPNTSGMTVAAQTTTDLSSVPSKSQKACRERAAKEFRVKSKAIRTTGLRLDRAAFRTLYLENMRTGETATCEVNPSNSSVTSFEKTAPGPPGGQTDQETVMEFQIKTYRVRDYRLPSGTALMQVFNKGNDRSVLQNNPAVNSAGAGFNEYSACTTNRNPCDGTQYTARMEDSGRKSLNIKQRQNSAGVTEFAVQ